MSDSPNRATLRRKTEAALAHRRLANEILDSIVDSQNKWNKLIAKLDADDAASLDQDYSDSAGAAEITDITCVADSSGSLDGTYFIMYEPSGSVAFWIDVDDSGTIEPAHGADRSVEITTIATDDADTVVAGKVQAAIDGDSAFSAAVLGAVVTVTNAAEGDVTDADAGTSGFTMDVTSQGSAALGISDLFDADAEGEDAQHKASLRKSLRSALAHKKLADEICDSIEEMQAAMNALEAKLDAEAGTLNDTDYASSLGLSVLDGDIDAEGEDAQHKASLRRSLRSAMANRRAADQILDALIAMQEAFNASMDELDAGNVNGAHAGFAVDELDPDAE